MSEIRMGNVSLNPPKFVSQVQAVGVADTKLNAFDRALVKGKIGNVSLIKVTSILPQDVKFIKISDLPYGASLPAIYSSYVTDKADLIISAALGHVSTELGPVLVAEDSGEGPLKDRIIKVKNLLDVMCESRNTSPITKPYIEGCEAHTEAFTCVFAGIIYIPDENP